MMKRILWLGLALIVAFGAGWAWGVWGRSDISHALQVVEVRNQLLDARVAVADARLDIYDINFGNASHHLEMARSALRAAEVGLNGLGRREDAERLTVAFTRIDEAQRMAGQLNQNAKALAADAGKAIDDVLARLPAAPPG
jgi:hypothetical protein